MVGCRGRTGFGIAPNIGSEAVVGVDLICR